MISCVLIVLLSFQNLDNIHAYDGCENPDAWRCGDKCISGWGHGDYCKCGREYFKKTAQMWCCNDLPCIGVGIKPTNTWYGKKHEEGREIGAECSGKPLKLTQPCNQTCNDHRSGSLADHHHLLFFPYPHCNLWRRLS